MSQHESLTFSTVSISPHFCQISVNIPSQIVTRVYELTAKAQQKKVEAEGFGRGAIPLDYIKRNYHNSLEAHTKEFIFNYLVISYLLTKLQEQKIIVIGDPRLKEIEITHEGDAQFEFECTVPARFMINAWKHLPFKAPGRKHYRDIDRQVEAFIQEEEKLKESYTYPMSVMINDIICFSLWVVEENNEPVFNTHKETLWLKIGSEEGDTPFQTLFTGKHVGDIFYSNNRCLQEYFSNRLEEYATFGIQVIEILPTHFFCLNSFKEHFRIKTAKDMRRKLIEVFSYRNDLSQRRLMAEGALSLLMKHNPISIPHHAVLRRQQTILNTLSKNPDYPVYKMKRDFAYRVEQLAVKQLREMVLIDSISYTDSLNISGSDTNYYLNLTKRPRTKEFVYFATPHTKINGQEIPISLYQLKQYALREKTLNHVIHHLTRQ